MSRSSTRTPSRTTTLPATGGSRLSFLDHPMADYTLLLSATLVLLCLGLGGGHRVVERVGKDEPVSGAVEQVERIGFVVLCNRQCPHTG